MDQPGSRAGAHLDDVREFREVRSDDMNRTSVVLGWITDGSQVDDGIRALDRTPEIHDRGGIRNRSMMEGKARVVEVFANLGC